MLYGGSTIGSRSLGSVVKSTFLNVPTRRMVQSLFLPETNEVYLILVTIDHDDISQTIRAVNNNVNIVSNGNTFTAFPHKVILPDNREGAAPRAKLVIGNTSREIITEIRLITTPPTITLQVIRAADPDTIEVVYENFTMRNVKWDKTQISGELMHEQIELEAFPMGTFNPSEFPGML